MDAFFQVSGRIMPRYYTIASSSKMFPDDLKIGVSLTTAVLPSGKTKMGLTSQFLDKVFADFGSDKAQKVLCRAFVKDSMFDMPDNESTPMIMVGPGTGVVPFIGFMQERSLSDDISKLGEAKLYFGCRNRNSDFIYRDEIADRVDKKIISEANYAFSREQGKPKEYVQNLLEKIPDDLKRILIEEKGHFYICGSTKMGNDVVALLKKVLGEDQVKAMETEKRLIKELWSS